MADWTVRHDPKAPEGAPNVLVVLIDDAGFGNPEHLRRPDRDTRALTRVQEMGLTYNRFHVTAICSPTRAALLTGRNQHRVGFGSHRRVSRARSPATRPRSARAAPRCRGSCSDNGYVTGGFGKWHLTPDNVQMGLPVRSTAGPPAGASTTGGAS